MPEPEIHHNVYLLAGVFLATLPIDDIILTLGGIIIVLVGLSLIFKARRNKNSNRKLQRRMSGIKIHFTDIKDESINQKDDDWLEIKQKDESDKYKSQLGMNKK